MRTKLAVFLSRDYVILEHIALVGLALWLNAGVAAMYTGLLVVLITLWSKQWDWNFVAFKTLNWARAGKLALLWAVPVYALVAGIHFLVEFYFGKTDLSAFDAIRGNPLALLSIILYSWISAALGEELFFRGYVLHRLGIIYGSTRTGDFLALVLSSAIFSIGHSYQGTPGLVSTFLIGLLLGGIFLRYRSLKLVILLHAIIDTASLLFLYFELI